MRFLVVFLCALTFVSCYRDPNVAKKRYLEMGNRYFDRGQYKQARLLYRNALQKDLKFGPAYYKLALCDLRLGQVAPAVGELRRAIELDPNPAEKQDASIKLAELYLMLAPEKQYLDEVEATANGLLKKDPKSFDGHRLTAELLFLRARQSYQGGHADTARNLLRDSIVEYRKANDAKPDQVNVVLALARSLVVDQQLPEAETLYKSLLEKQKSLTTGYMELYRLYAFQNRISDAEGVLKKAIVENPKDYSYLTMLAAHYYQTKHKDEMVKLLNQIKSHAKEYPNAYLNVGDFYLRLNDADEAIRQYKEGISADGKRKATYQKRIIEVLIRQGQRAMAAEMNEAILRENPKDADARGLQASLLLEKGDVQKAVAELQSVVTSAPDNFVAQFNLGRAHYSRGEYEQARQRYSEAIRVRPDYLPARVALAQLQVRRGEYEAALKSAAEIMALDKLNAAAKLIESAAFLGLKKYDLARQVLDIMLKMDPNSTDALFQLGVVNLAEGKYPAAEEYFRKAYQLEAANSRGLMGQVEVLMAQGKEDGAIQLLQREIEKHPKRSDYHLALGNTGVRAGKYDLAISEFQTVVNLAEKNSKAAGDAYLRMGETYRRKGDLNNAVAVLQKARETLPDSSLVINTLALILDAAGRKHEARMAYEQCLKVDPRNGVALNNLAYLLAENNGDLDQALTYAQRAKQILPQLNEISDTLGWIYLKKNLTDSAIETFSDIVTKQPQHSTYRYHLGMAYVQKGDKLKASRELQRALKSNPSKDERDKIEQLLQKLG